MRLFDLDKRTYTPYPTPLEPLANLSKALGGPRIWIKRDDQLGLAAGGNKTRKLEYVMAAALADGARSVMTVGAVQSNHCRLTLSAARREGLKCYLVLEERVKDTYAPTASGNNLLYRLMGADRIFVSPFGSDIEQTIAAAQDEVERESGHRPHFIPGGASTPLGATGYAAAMLELLGQCRDHKVNFEALVVASGSGGTHAGLQAGAALFGFPGTIRGISVRHPAEAQATKIRSLSSETLSFLESDAEIGEDDVHVADDWVGPGYSIPDERTFEAIDLFAEQEGILLDPVYTGKAAAGLIGLVRAGHFDADADVLFWHTGGSPALYAYGDQLLAEKT